MRARAWLVLAITGAAMLLPQTASAGCFAACATFMELNRTYYVPGEGGSGSASVWIPEKKRESILDAGPFFAWLLPRGTSLRTDRPIPAGAVKLGEFDVTTVKDETRLSIDFEMPLVPSGLYSVGVCNEPCSQLGLGQPIEGSLWVVATARERELLVRQGELRSKIYGLQRDARKGAKNLADAEAAIGATTRDLENANEEIATLRAALQNAPEPAQPSRHLADPWAVIAAAAIVGIAVVVRRRRAGSAVTPAATEPIEPREPELPQGPEREAATERELVGASR